MIPDWFRVDCDIVDSPKVGRLADALDVDTATAIGHLVAVYARVRQHRPLDGSLAGVSARTLEQWALWAGVRGRFATAFRREFVADEKLNGWEERQAPLIKRIEAERERSRRRAAEARKTDPDDHDDLPPDGSTAEGTAVRTAVGAEQVPVATGTGTGTGEILPAILPMGARVSEPRDVRPATEQDVAAITGVLIGDIAGAALLWTIALNRGITEAHGEQPVPIRHDAQLEAAEDLLAAGVDVAWGANWLYHRAKRATRRSIPRTLAYVATGLRDAWADHLADERQREHAAAFVPSESSPSTAVVRAVSSAGRAPQTRTDRVVERSVQGSLSAIARYKQGRTA